MKDAEKIVDKAKQEKPFVEGKSVVVLIGSERDQSNLISESKETKYTIKADLHDRANPLRCLQPFEMQ